MQNRDLNPKNLAHDEDWVGNNAAFTCPHCGKVFLVNSTGSSASIHRQFGQTALAGERGRSNRPWQARVQPERER